MIGCRSESRTACELSTFLRERRSHVDVTTGNESVLAGVPKQRDDDGGAGHRAALAELAAVASAQVSRRKQVRAEVEDELVVEEAELERARSSWRAVGVLALVVAIAACVATIVLTLPKQPHASAGRSSVSIASVATARALGDSARTRLTAAGQVVTLTTCLSAYAADAAASPLLLPAPSRSSVLRDRYVAACLSS